MTAEEEEFIYTKSHKFSNVQMKENTKTSDWQGTPKNLFIGYRVSAP